MECMRGALLCHIVSNWPSTTEIAFWLAQPARVDDDKVIIADPDAPPLWARRRSDRATSLQIPPGSMLREMITAQTRRPFLLTVGDPNLFGDLPSHLARRRRQTVGPAGV